MAMVNRHPDRSGRITWKSPGRPPVASRVELRQFWKSIAAGLSSEVAAEKAGISQPVGTRLFQIAGGMAPSIFSASSKPLSGRYLSFTDREEIALLRVRDVSMRQIALRLGQAVSTISRELRRNVAARNGGHGYRATTAQLSNRLQP